MAAHPELEFLKSKVASGQVDTVVACIPDMQGRLMGKRFHASHFVDSAWEETHCCDYLVATDLEMHPVDGYASTSWAAGYGDHVLRPDLSTMRYPSWLEGTAVVLGDLLDHHGHDLVPHAPRTVLKRQIERLSSRGLSLSVATELEFFLFRESYDDLRDRNYRSMTPSSPYNEDYHVFQTTRDEDVMRAIRNGLHAAGVAVENTKGEADPGQQEINIRHDAALETADTHVFVKNAIKEIAFQKGRSVTFMAKWNADAAGSSCHIHQSVTDSSGESTFFDPVQDHGMSRLMRQYLAGLLTHSAATTVFLAPYVNSYKRFVAGTFAPTKAVWAIDNRTAGFRIAGAGTNGVRVECRIGGADLNPYLAIAGQIAAGLAGIDAELELEDVFAGDAYQAVDSRSIPATLRDAADALEASEMLRSAMGNNVIDHYVRSARWEQEHFDRAVTDYEVARGLERA